MQALPKFFHYLSMGNPFFSSRSLSLGNGKLSEKLDPCFESFVMFDAHDNEVTFAIGSQINRLVLFMT
jgi:hypothetical protein